MIVHLCSHFGDIEVEEVEGHDDQALIRFYRLTPMERESLDAYLTGLDLQRSNDEGEILVPKSVAEVGDALGGQLHEGQALLTAVRFSTGEVEVSKKPLLEWFRGLIARHAPPWKDAKPIIPAAVVRKPPPPREIEAAVQVPVPQRGCPMPDYTELREAKAAGVVRKFLQGQQIADFDKHRAFMTVGCDTGRIYQVTTRWSPHVSRKGVLYDQTRQRSICASNQEMPPSEEALSMLFAVETMEADFLGHHGRFPA